MNIAVTTYGGDGGKSGISRYIINVLREMAKLARNDRVDVYAFADEASLFIPPDSGYGLVPGPEWMRKPVPNIFWHQAFLPGALRKQRADVLFLPAANRRVPLWSPVPMVGTVHDFSSLHVAGKYDTGRNFYIRKVLPALVRRLDHVLTVSECSKRDIVEYAGVPHEKVTVTPLAADLSVFRVPDNPEPIRAQLAQEFGLSKPYFLYTSRLEHPGKNHVRLIQAFDRMKQAVDCPHELVLAGSDWSGAEAIKQAAAEVKHRESIRFLGFVPGASLPALYAMCEAFIFPSLYEGFGLPLLEAMACGVPVACANISSLPEVAGEAAALFDPYSVEELGTLLGRLVQDSAYCQQLRSAGLARCQEFSWHKAAASTYKVLQMVREQRS